METKPSSGKKENIWNKLCWFKRWLAYRRMKIDLFFFPCTKLKSKLIKNFHIKLDKMTLIEVWVRMNHKYIGIGENFLNRIPMAYALRSLSYKWVLMKSKIFCEAKITVKKRNDNLQIGKRSSLTLHPTERWYPKYIQNSRRKTQKKQPSPKNLKQPNIITEQKPNQNKKSPKNQITQLKMMYRTKQRILN